MTPPQVAHRARPAADHLQRTPIGFARYPRTPSTNGRFIRGAVVGVALEVSKSEGGAAELVEEPVGLSEPVRTYGAG